MLERVLSSENEKRTSHANIHTHTHSDVEAVAFENISPRAICKTIVF